VGSHQRFEFPCQAVMERPVVAASIDEVILIFGDQQKNVFKNQNLDYVSEAFVAAEMQGEKTHHMT
jgi:hypothetical protein